MQDLNSLARVAKQNAILLGEKTRITIESKPKTILKVEKNNLETNNFELLTDSVISTKIELPENISIIFDQEKTDFHILFSKSGTCQSFQIKMQRQDSDQKTFATFILNPFLCKFEIKEFEEESLE